MKRFVLTRIIGLSLLSVTMSFASAEKCKCYEDMSTGELQKKVEELSASDKLPFGMGIELMKRWANN